MNRSLIRGTIPNALVRAAQWLSGPVSKDPFQSIETHLGHWQTSGRFRRGNNPLQFSAVYACVSVISNDVAKLHPKIVQQRDDRGQDEITNTAVYRVLNKPNHYQTRIDFFIYFVTSYLLYGNSFVYIERDGTGAVSALYPIPPSDVTIAIGEDGEVFYDISESITTGFKLNTGTSGKRIRVPSRNIIHHRVLTYDNPLLGITPIMAAALSANTGLKILEQSDRFFANLQRPNGILTSEGSLGKDALARLSAVWKEANQGDNFGKVAVFDGGIKWQPLTMSAADAQLIEQLKFGVADVARAFRVPLFLLGEANTATFKNAETLMSVYYSQTLSFHLEHIEERFNQALGLSRLNQRMKFDLKDLLRTDLKERIEAYTRGIQQGMFTPNEARDWEGLNPMDGGDSLFVQSQMIPLDMARENASKGTPNPAPVSNDSQDSQDTPDPQDSQDTPDPATADKALRSAVRSVILKRLAA